MHKVMEKVPHVSTVAYATLMGLSTIVCAIVAGSAACDALGLLKSAHGIQPKLHANATGLMTLVAAGIFGCISCSCAKNFLQARKK